MSARRFVVRFLLASLAAAGCGDPIDYAAIEQQCEGTGGVLTSVRCCDGVLDYPATCGEDPCAACPDGPTVLYCQCPVQHCFDGGFCEHELLD